MPFEKGNTYGKAGTRRGRPNKATAEVREVISRLANDTAPELKAWLAEIDDPAKRLDLFLKMLEYHIPKLGRTEHTGEDGGPLQVIVQKVSE